MIAVLLGVLVVIAAVAIASGASTPSTPTILTTPANPTNVTSFTFTFSAPPAGVTNQCKLDAGPFGSCTTATSYATGVLAPNLSHTFQVRAKNNGDSKTSVVASYTWLIDTALPAAPLVTSGPSPLPGWSTTTAAKFTWTGESGASFLCSLNLGSDVACSSGVTFTVGQGSRSFRVRARDAAGNLGAWSSLYEWRVDSIAPPAPVLVIFPDDPNGDGIADFTWTVTPAESPLTFTCQVENFAFEACTSPFHKIVDVSNNQQHQFVVRAFDAAGNYSQTSYMWKVLQSVRLTITGNAVGLLYPGAPAVGIDVLLHNPNNFPVYVNALDVTVVGGPGCVAGNFEIVPPADIDATPAKRVLVPANNTAHVPTGQRPKIRMKNLPLAQNNPASSSYNCANKQVSLDFYSGSVTK